MYEFTKKSLDYTVISTIRYPMMMMVVLSHLNTSDAHVITHTGSGDLLYYFLMYFLSRNVTCCVNSMFFFISGFLYFANVIGWFTLEDYKRKTVSRVKSLLVPYLIWNAIVLAIYFIVALCGSKDIKSLMDLNSFWQKGWSPESMGTPIDGPLWFIRDLFIQALLAPLTYFMVKHFHVFYIIFLGGLFYLGVGMTGLAPVAYLFFAIGAMFGIHKISFTSLSCKYSILFFIIAAMALLYRSYCSIGGHEDVSHGLLWNIFGIAALLCLVSYFKPSFPKICTDSTFFLYAIHQPLIIVPLYLFFKAEGWDRHIWGVNGMFIIAFIASLSICALMSYLAKKYFPKFYSILSGGR